MRVCTLVTLGRAHMKSHYKPHLVDLDSLWPPSPNTRPLWRGLPRRQSKEEYDHPWYDTIWRTKTHELYYEHQRSTQRKRCARTHIRNHYTLRSQKWIWICITPKHTFISTAPDSPWDAQRLVPRLRGSGSAPSSHKSICMCAVAHICHQHGITTLTKLPSQLAFHKASSLPLNWLGILDMRRFNTYAVFGGFRAKYIRQLICKSCHLQTQRFHSKKSFKSTVNMWTMRKAQRSIYVSKRAHTTHKMRNK